MKRKSDTVRYTAAELNEMRRKGQDKTDEARLESAPEDEDDFDWARAEVGIPAPKQQLTVRFDSDLVRWFKSQGVGYQTRMNAVLRRYMETHKSDR